jgi:hypothetical protein
MQPLHIQVQSSLQCIIGQGGSTSSSSSPESIHFAQQTLLALENDHVDEYVLLLVKTATSSAETLTVTSSEASKLRLAAILTLKAAILRRWKDRGRGGGRSTDNTNESTRQRYLSETVKQNVRMSLLNLVTARSSGHHQEQQQQQQQQLQLIIELQQDRQLQHNVSAVLAKIGRLDLPLKFHDLIPTLVTTIQECQQQLQQLQQLQQQQQQDQSIQLQQTIQ